MEINDFIKNFSNQFDETEFEEFLSDTIFKNLEEWSSLTALAVINMVSKKYNVTINGDDIKAASTIQDLFNIIQSKQ